VTAELMHIVSSKLFFVYL